MIIGDVGDARDAATLGTVIMATKAKPDGGTGARAAANGEEMAGNVEQQLGWFLTTDHEANAGLVPHY